jgi:ATP-dependent DNA helicase RecG
MMTPERVLELIGQGESNSLEFKEEQVRPESLAREMVAFANTLGGLLLIGVTDDGALVGVGDPAGIAHRIVNVARHSVVPALQPTVEVVVVDGKSVCVVVVDKGTAKPYQTLEGKFLLRVGPTNRQATKEELSRLFQAAGLVHFDLSPVEGTDHDHLDPARLNDYWQSCYQIPYTDLERGEQFNILCNADILVPLDEGWAVSVGGLLLFGRQPQRRLPQSAISFAVFDGDEITADLLDKKELTGTLPELIDRGAALIRLFLPRPSTVTDLRRNEQDKIPPKVLREALVNAVCHRDYSLINRKIQVFVYRGRVEIRSPGRLPNTLNLEKIRYGNSAPRNLFILKYLDNLRYVDGLGRGIPMILREMGERARFEEIGELFVLTLAYS